MSDLYDKRLQPTYKINVSIEYYDTELKRRNIVKLDPFSVNTYEVSKDSSNYNYNLHLLTLSNITLSMYNNFQLDDIRIIISVLEMDIEISNTSFRVIKTHKIEEIEGKFNLQLVMVSEFIYDFMNSNNYTKVSTLDSNVVTQTYITSYQLVSKIFQKISSDFGQKVSTNLSNAGEVKKLYDSIRIPENYDNVSMFNWLFKEYPPLLLSPYLIIDDFNFSTDNFSEIDIFLLNICDINGSYPLKKYKNIPGVNIGEIKYLGSAPLLNYKDVYNELQSTLMIKNSNENKLYELKPLLPSNRNGKVMQIESSLEIDAYKSKMYMKKQLAETEASIVTYAYNGLGLKDITFGNVYDVVETMNFNHLPISIYYNFIKRSDNTFILETTVDYINMPGSLISKPK